MGTYKGPGWYDKPSKWMTRRGGSKAISYKPPWPARAWWATRFELMTKHVPYRAAILDIGCGNGLFAAYLWHSGIGGRSEYTGYDFSLGSIQQAKVGNEAYGHQKAKFFRKDIMDIDIAGELKKLGPKALLVCAETLEHVEDDLAVVAKIPAGTEFLFTVPMFDADAHVRWFPTPKSIEDRWGEHFEDGYVIERMAAKYRPAPRQCHLIRGRWK